MFTQHFFALVSLFLFKLGFRMGQNEMLLFGNVQYYGTSHYYRMIRNRSNTARMEVEVARSVDAYIILRHWMHPFHNCQWGQCSDKGMSNGAQPVKYMKRITQRCILWIFSSEPNSTAAPYKRVNSEFVEKTIPRIGNGLLKTIFYYLWISYYGYLLSKPIDIWSRIILNWSFNW